MTVSTSNPVTLYPLGDGIGSVSLVQVVGDDKMIVNAARVSFGGDNDAPLNSRDEKLIRYLLTHHHGSPFEHNLITFKVVCPIFVDRQMVRHRVGTCLTGDTVVSFVNINGEAQPRLKKTMAELYRMWTEGEAHAMTASPERVTTALRVLKEEGGRYGAMAKAVKESGLSRNTVQRYTRGNVMGHRSSKKRLQKMRLRVLNENTGLFTSGHIADVMYQGEQPVYRVTLADGKALTMTPHHRVITSQGWQTMAEALGLEIHGQTAVMSREAFFMVNGLEVYRDRGWLAEQRAQGKGVQQIADEAGCSYHTVRKWLKIHGLQFLPEETRFPEGFTPWNKGKGGYRAPRVFTEEHRAAIRAARSGERSNFWKGGVSSERANINRWTWEQSRRVHEKFDFTCQNCGERKLELHAHHIVPVWADRSLALTFNNLVTICGACHRDIHRSQENEMAFAQRFNPDAVISGERPKPRGRKLKAHPVKVVKVDYLGIQPTYDLEVDGDWHNFVANGIVVHNSKNEVSGRYVELQERNFTPPSFRKQAPSNRQASVEDDGTLDQEAAAQIWAEAWRNAYAAYQALLRLGVTREQARGVLPVSLYTESYYTFNVRSLLHFLELRDHEGAQYETRLFARAMAELAEPLFPVTFREWRELHAQG
ncbi:FAD-dependent thymidylate synthase [Deinococcus planocerae]|uniref:FAD-dependent thymidylate synthase n=1 Tax=Deinococcus planocerae TaxID=1737569 RepID=UPI001FE8F7E8|nr:FAD-dependent thymidylate synthase [Deinococcus planocerae]